MARGNKLIGLLLTTLVIPFAHIHSLNQQPEPPKNEKKEKEQKKMSVWTKLGIAGATLGAAIAAAAVYTLYPSTTTFTPERRDLENQKLKNLTRRYDAIIDRFENGTYRTEEDRQAINFLTAEELMKLSGKADNKAKQYLKAQAKYEKYMDKLSKCPDENLVTCIDKIVTPVAPDLALLMKQDVYSTWLNFYEEVQGTTISEIRRKYLDEK